MALMVTDKLSKRRRRRDQPEGVRRLSQSDAAIGDEPGVDRPFGKLFIVRTPTEKPDIGANSRDQRTIKEFNQFAQRMV
jgi:hypothetical protein